MINPEDMTAEELRLHVQATQASVIRLTMTLELADITLRTDIEEFQETMREEELCVLCPNGCAFRDVLGIPWCAEHSFRGEFLNLMAARRYPGVYVGAEPYQLERGVWFTATNALIASDECVVLLGAAALEQREVA